MGNAASARHQCEGSTDGIGATSWLFFRSTTRKSVRSARISATTSSCVRSICSILVAGVIGASRRSVSQQAESPSCGPLCRCSICPAHCRSGRPPIAHLLGGDTDSVAAMTAPMAVVPSTSTRRRHVLSRQTERRVPWMPKSFPSRSSARAAAQVSTYPQVGLDHRQRICRRPRNTGVAMVPAHCSDGAA